MPYIVTDRSGYVYHDADGNHIHDSLSDVKSVIKHVCDEAQEPYTLERFQVYTITPYSQKIK